MDNYAVGSRAIAEGAANEARGKGAAPEGVATVVRRGRVLAVTGDLAQIGIVNGSGRVTKIYSGVRTQGLTLAVDDAVTVEVNMVSNTAALMSAGGGGGAVGCDAAITMHGTLTLV